MAFSRLLLKDPSTKGARLRQARWLLLALAAAAATASVPVRADEAAPEQRIRPVALLLVDDAVISAKPGTTAPTPRGVAETIRLALFNKGRVVIHTRADLKVFPVSTSDARLQVRRGRPAGGVISSLAKSMGLDFYHVLESRVSLVGKSFKWYGSLNRHQVKGDGDPEKLARLGPVDLIVDGEIQYGALDRIGRWVREEIHEKGPILARRHRFAVGCFRDASRSAEETSFLAVELPSLLLDHLVTKKDLEPVPPYPGLGDSCQTAVDIPKFILTHDLEFFLEGSYNVDAERLTIAPRLHRRGHEAPHALPVFSGRMYVFLSKLDEFNEQVYGAIRLALQQPARKVVADRTDPRVESGRLLALGTELNDKRKFADAIEPLRRAVGELRDDYRAHHQLGRAYLGFGDFINAESNLLLAVRLLTRKSKPSELGPAHARVYYDLARANMRGDKPKAAARNFARALEIDSRLEDAYSKLGRALWHLGRYDEAVPWLKRAISLDPGNRVLYRDLANSFLKRELPSHELAASVLLQARAQFPDDSVLEQDLTVLADSAADTEQFDIALNVLDHLIGSREAKGGKRSVDLYLTRARTRLQNWKQRKGFDPAYIGEDGKSGALRDLETATKLAKSQYKDRERLYVIQLEFAEAAIMAGWPSTTENAALTAIEGLSAASTYRPVARFLLFVSRLLQRKDTRDAEAALTESIEAAQRWPVLLDYREYWDFGLLEGYIAQLRDAEEQTRERILTLSAEIQKKLMKKEKAFQDEKAQKDREASKAGKG